MDQDNPDYRFADSLTRVQIVHKPTKTVLQVRSSNPKTTMGLVNTPWVIADEPGAWAVNDGALMFDAISTSLGKPNSPLKALFIGTLAPAQGGWWHDLIDRGSHHSTYVQAIQGDRETWDSWQTIRKANPLTAISPEFRKQLLEERDAASGRPPAESPVPLLPPERPDRRRIRGAADSRGLQAGDGPGGCAGHRPADCRRGPGSKPELDRRGSHLGDGANRGHGY